VRQGVAGPGAGTSSETSSGKATPPLGRHSGLEGGQSSLTAVFRAALRSQSMNARYRCFRRASGVFYLEDTTTHQQSSLKTRDKHEAARLTHARNEAHLQPQLNRRIAQAYLAAGDPQALTRTWQDVMEAAVQLKSGANQVRWVARGCPTTLQARRWLSSSSRWRCPTASRFRAGPTIFPPATPSRPPCPATDPPPAS